MAGRTEWEDILIDKGIIEAPEPEAPIILETYDPKMGKSLEEMDADELEDELDNLLDEDEELILRRMREQRLKEMKESAATSRFGNVRQISREEFVQQVNEEKGPVILNLFQPHVADSMLLCDRFEKLAAKFPATKFLKIIATDCIDNYPDANVPTVLIYKDGTPLTQLVGLSSFHGRDTSADDVEWVLAQLGVVGSDLDEDPRESEADFRDLRVDRGFVSTLKLDAYDEVHAEDDTLRRR